MTRTTIHILPNDKQWEVIEEGELLGAFTTREDAIEYVRWIAKGLRDAHVVIHTWDYDLEQEIVLSPEHRDWAKADEDWAIR